MRILVSLAAVVVLAVIAATPASAHRDFQYECPDQRTPINGGPYTDLKADNVTCRVAGKLATKYTTMPFGSGWHDWDCHGTIIGHEKLKIKCVRDRGGIQTVKFHWGAA